VSGLTHPICRSRYAIDGVFASLVYKGVAKKLIYQFKFAPFLQNLSVMLIDLFYEGLIQQEVVIKAFSSDAVFVPIPLHLSKERSRGYNQSLILSKGLSKKLGIETKIILIRSKKTISQVGKTQKERKENIKGAFTLKYPLDLSGRTIFLIDDVVTSGSTFNEAANVLKRAGAEKVYGLALAHGL